MKLAKHWARESTFTENSSGDEYHLISWAGSNFDLAEAKQKALAKLERWKAALKQGEPLGFYPYVDKDEIREELVEEFFDDNGALIAAITRNRYGALVLNSANVLFADVDLPPQEHKEHKEPSIFSKLLSAFGKKDVEVDPRQESQTQCRQHFAAFHNAHPELALRVYETYAGFRLVVLNRLFEPLGEETQMLLEEMNSDSLYIRLCRKQECFRARLTPKPWRCRFNAPPYQCNFPRERLASKQRFETWLEIYEDRSKEFGVCNLVDEFGPVESIATAQTIIQIHDEYVLNAGKRLA